MQQRGPWTRHHGELLYATPRVGLHRDRVTLPDGTAGAYDWIDTPDLVRVAALDTGTILLIRQYHYLLGETWQCPGGAIDDGESSLDAARRELAEETGYQGGTFNPVGVVFPLPGLTPARIHLWQARNLTAGPARPEPSETDLTVLRIPVGEAVDAVHSGRVGCAASAALILWSAYDVPVAARATTVHRRGGLGMLTRPRTKLIRRHAARQVYVQVQTGLRRILIGGEIATDETSSEIGALRDVLHRFGTLLAPAAPQIPSRVEAAIRVVEETARHADHTAGRAAVEALHHLGTPHSADVLRLTKRITVAAARLDTQGGSTRTAAVTIVDTATRTAAHHPGPQATSAAVDQIEQCLHTIAAVNAPLKTQAIALLDTTLDDLVRIFDIPDYRRQPPPQFASTNPGSR